MITLLHGDHIDASRRELQRLKESSHAREIRVVDGASVDEAALTQALESSSLFHTDTSVFIELLFAKIGRQQKRIEQLATILKRSAAMTDIVIWEDKEVGLSVVKALGSDIHVQLFKLPVLIFQFLDNVIPGNAAHELTLLHELTRQEPAELVFSMLVKRIRQLIQVSEGITPERISPWQLTRLTKQGKSFTMEQLIDLYRNLHDAETQVRLGLSAFRTQQLLELFLTKL